MNLYNWQIEGNISATGVRVFTQNGLTNGEDFIANLAAVLTSQLWWYPIRYIAYLTMGIMHEANITGCLAINLTFINKCLLKIWLLHAQVFPKLRDLLLLSLNWNVFNVHKNKGIVFFINFNWFYTAEFAENFF